MAESQINEHITCVICSSIFNDPCTLTCGHSFCRVCLTKHTKNHPRAFKSKSLPCAVCRQSTKVPTPSKPVDEWAWQIKPSLLLQGLVDSHRTNEQRNGQGSHRRDDHDSPRRNDGGTDTCCACAGVGETTEATFWCKRCNQLLCNRCAKMHTKAPFTKNHDVLLISEAVKKQIENRNQEIKERERLNKGDFHTYRKTLSPLPVDLGHAMGNDYQLRRNHYTAFQEPVYPGTYGNRFPLPELGPHPALLVPPPVFLVEEPQVTYSEDYHGLSSSQLNRRYDQLIEEQEYSGIPYQVYRGKSTRELILTDVVYKPEAGGKPRNREVVSSQASINSSNEHTNTNEDSSSQAGRSTASDESIYCTIDTS